ncbi:checkpoint clamp complex protein Rad1 [Rhodosporidiobolus nylandii]
MDAQDHILVASMADVRPLASMLRSLSFRSLATVRFDKRGLRVTVEEGRGIQAHAYINSTAFASYKFQVDRDDPAARLDDPPGSPGSSPVPEATEDEPDLHCLTSVSLSTMLECLNIFGNAGGSGSSGNPFKRERESSVDGGEDGPGGRGRRRKQGAAREEAEEPIGKERTSLRISYKASGEPLVMLLEESGIVTRCELTTYEPDGMLDLAFPVEDQVSEWLRDALADLPPSSEKLTISFAPPHLVSHAQANTGRYKRRRLGSEGFDQDGEEEGQEGDEEVPLFRLESVGTMGSTELDYTDDKDVLEVFECEQAVRNSYSYKHLQLTKSALSASVKTVFCLSRRYSPPALTCCSSSSRDAPPLPAHQSIRTSQHGLVSFQFMIPLSARGPKASLQEDRVGFVEFLCLPLDEEY